MTVEGEGGRQTPFSPRLAMILVPLWACPACLVFTQVGDEPLRAGAALGMLACLSVPMGCWVASRAGGGLRAAGLLGAAVGAATLTGLAAYPPGGIGYWYGGLRVGLWALTLPAWGALALALYSLRRPEWWTASIALGFVSGLAGPPALLAMIFDAAM